jgi:hypothetical protein
MKHIKIKIKRAHEGMKIDEPSLLNVEFKNYIPKIVTSRPPNSHESVDYLFFTQF